MLVELRALVVQALRALRALEVQVLRDLQVLLVQRVLEFLREVLQDKFSRKGLGQITIPFGALRVVGVVGV